MERQLINTSGKFLLDNFMNSNPQANLSTIIDLIIQEGQKENNSKLLIEYVTQNYQTFWEMLLIINFDETSNNFTYPFIVTEVIKKKPEQIFDFLFQLDRIELNDSLNFLFQTLDRDCLNETIAGYFSKFVCSFIKIRGQDLWNYLQFNGKYVFEDLMKNIHINHIANIIYKLIGLIKNKGNQASNYNQLRIFLLCRIINILLNKSYDSQIVENVSNILLKLLRKVRDQEFKSLILEKICIPDNFFELIFLTKSHHLVDLLIQLLYEIKQFTIITQNSQPDFQFNYQQFEIIGKRFGSALKMELNLNKFVNSYGVEQEILGQTKLKLIEFYYIILQTNEMALINYFNHQEIYQILIELIQKYEFNNQLQNYFMQITIFIFCNQNLEHIQQIIYNLNIFGFLWFLNKDYLKQVGLIKKPITKGYQGMANKLSYFFREIQFIEEWSQYIQNHQQIFNIENNYLFGIPPGQEYDNQEEDQKQPQQNQIQQEPSQNEIEQNLPLQLDENQVRKAVIQAEVNFQDESNIAEVLGEQLLHQIIKKQKKNISKSGYIISEQEFETRFKGQITQSANDNRPRRRSLTSQNAQQNHNTSLTQSAILFRHVDNKNDDLNSNDQQEKDN